MSLTFYPVYIPGVLITPEAVDPEKLSAGHENFLGIPPDQIDVDEFLESRTDVNPSMLRRVYPFTGAFVTDANGDREVFEADPVFVCPFDGSEISVRAETTKCRRQLDDWLRDDFDVAANCGVLVGTTWG